MAKDYYETLGVSRDATDEQIKTAFRQQSKKWHPDLQQGKTDAEKKEAEEKFKQLNEAYSTLSDKDKRAQYDQFGTADDQPFSSVFSDDMFSGMFRHFGFGQNARAQKRPPPNVSAPEDGDNIITSMSITFKDAAFGMTKDFDICLDEPCAKCQGTGVEGGKEAKFEECPHCHGGGTITKTVRSGFMMQMSTMPCPHCFGSGYTVKQCEECHGTKRTMKSKHMTIKIPAGIQDGAKLRIKDHGHCGTCGGRNGDLIVVVQVSPSGLFTRLDNDDLLVKVKVSPAAAALGGDVEFPTLKKIKKLKIPAGTKNGARFKAKGEGLKDINGVQHDILVDVLVETPTCLTSEQKDLLKKLQKSFTDSNLPEKKAQMEEADRFYKE